MNTQELIKKHETCIAILELIETAKNNIVDHYLTIDRLSGLPGQEKYCSFLRNKITSLRGAIERLKLRYNKTLND